LLRQLLTANSLANYEGIWTKTLFCSCGAFLG
jgi:hypothetical protein